MFIRLAEGLIDIMGQLLTLPRFDISATINHKYSFNDDEVLISSYLTFLLLSDLDGNVSLNSHPVGRLLPASVKVKKYVLFLNLLWTSNLASLSFSFFIVKWDIF